MERETLWRKRERERERELVESKSKSGRLPKGGWLVGE